jgi:cation:H+ antiporter
MTLNILIFIAGVFGLTLGANKLVTHSSNIAAHFNIRPFIIGVTIIAFGTSAPELVVSFAAAMKDTTAMALGNVLGSNVANIGLILGFTSLISPMRVEDNILKKEVKIMLASVLLLYLQSLDGLISRVDGIILFAGIVLFTRYCIRSHKAENNEAKKNDDESEEKPKDSVTKSFILTLVGLFLLVAGAHLMVENAVIIAKAFGISELFIGITMVAVGTSLPELAASTAAIIQQKGDIGIGNIVGSNIFNVFLVLGAVAIVKPISVEKSLLSFEYPVMVGFSLLLYILGKRGQVFSRKDGAFLLILYVVFISILYHNLK